MHNMHPLKNLKCITGELSALEDLVAHLIRHQPQPLLKPITLRALWWLCQQAHRAASAPPNDEVGSLYLACSAMRLQHFLKLPTSAQLHPHLVPVSCMQCNKFDFVGPLLFVATTLRSHTRGMLSQHAQPGAQSTGAFPHDVVCVWDVQAAQDGAAEADRDNVQEVRGALLLISMAAAVQPDIVADNLDTLLQVCCS